MSSPISSMDDASSLFGVSGEICFSTSAISPEASSIESTSPLPANISSSREIVGALSEGMVSFFSLEGVASCSSSKIPSSHSSSAEFMSCSGALLSSSFTISSSALSKISSDLSLLPCITHYP